MFRSSSTIVRAVLRRGSVEFRNWCKLTHEKFETSGDESLLITFVGFQISRNKHNLLSIRQTFCMRRLEELDPSLPFTDFRSMRMRLAWLANTRPDISFEISRLAQITLDRFNEGARAHWKRLNSAIRYAHDNMVNLKFPKIELNRVRIFGYSDTAFANNADKKSQLGRIIL